LIHGEWGNPTCMGNKNNLVSIQNNSKRGEVKTIEGNSHVVQAKGFVKLME